jgi:hypothetical protein
MSAREMEVINETEIFTEALVASVALGDLTVDELKRRLEDGLAYVEAQGADNVADELLVALAALERVNRGMTGSPSIAYKIARQRERPLAGGGDRWREV